MQYGVQRLGADTDVDEEHGGPRLGLVHGHRFESHPAGAVRAHADRRQRVHGRDHAV